MSGTRYIVSIDLKTTGNLDTGLGKAGQAATGLHGKLGQVGSALSGISHKVMGLADKVAQVAWRWGSIAAIGGATAAVGGLTYAVGSLNNQLEQTEISLGTIFSAQGVAADLPSGLKLAADELERMRVDAAKLPGEFEDLVGFMTNAAIPAFRAGADPGALRALSAKAMATAAVAQVPMDQAAREFAMLLEGRSGAHNVFGMRLMGLTGDAAQEFNKLSPEKRLAKLNTELDKYGTSIDRFATSFEGQFSTAVDNAKNLLRLASEPLFEEAKDVLAEINEYLSSPVVEVWAREAGESIADAFEWGREKIAEWWPAIQAFAINAYAKLAGIWEKAQPYVERFGDALQAALKDPGTIDKLVNLLKLYVAAKGAQAVGGPLLSLGGGALSALGALKSLGALGGGAAAAGAGAAGTAAAGAAGAAGAGAAGAGAAAAGAGGMLSGVTASASIPLIGGTGATVAAGGLAAVGMIAGSVALALGGVGLAAYNAAKLDEEITEQHKADQEAIQKWAEREVSRSKDSATAAHDSAMMLSRLREVAERTGDPLDKLRADTFAQASAAEQAKFALDKLHSGALTAADTLARLGGDRKEMETGSKRKAYAQMWDLWAASVNKGARGKPVAKHGGGGGGTRIQKVEIVVTTNQNPSRVAHEIFDVVGQVAHQKRRTYSPNVSNYSRRG